MKDSQGIPRYFAYGLKTFLVKEAVKSDMGTA